MNPGLGESGERVATSLIDSLKAQPMTLALVVFNIIFIFAVFFGLKDARDQAEKFQQMTFQQQKETMELLYKCAPIKEQEQR